MKITEFLRTNGLNIVVLSEEIYDDTGSVKRKIRASLQQKRFKNDYKLEVWLPGQTTKKPGAVGTTSEEAITKMFNGLLDIRKIYPDHCLSTISVQGYTDSEGKWVKEVYNVIPESFENDLQETKNAN